MKTSFKSIAFAVAFSALFAFNAFADNKETKNVPVSEQAFLLLKVVKSISM